VVKDFLIRILLIYFHRAPTHRRGGSADLVIGQPNESPPRKKMLYVGATHNPTGKSCQRMSHSARGKSAVDCNDFGIRSWPGRDIAKYVVCIDSFWTTSMVISSKVLGAFYAMQLITSVWHSPSLGHPCRK